MKKSGLLLALTLTGLMLASCGGESASSESSASSEASSTETSSSSATASSASASRSGSALRLRSSSFTADESGNYTCAFGSAVTVSLTKESAASAITVESDHIVLPAGAKFSVTASTGYYLYTYTSVSGDTSSNYAYLGFQDETNATTASTSMTLTGATAGAVSGTQIPLTIADGTTAYSFTSTADLSLTSVFLVYGK